jgi:nitroreductase
MQVLQAIRGRRSVREYLPTALTHVELELLIDAAIQAPSALNHQAWAFVVIQDKALLRRYSDRIKPLVLAGLPGIGLSAQFAKTLSDPAYHVFHDAPALTAICARGDDPFATIDCCLAGQNLMLAAHGMGLASCWIGLAQGWLNQEPVKDELGIPRDWTVVAPIVVGHPRGPAPPAPQRRAPEVRWR